MLLAILEELEWLIGGSLHHCILSLQERVHSLVQLQIGRFMISVWPNYLRPVGLLNDLVSGDDDVGERHLYTVSGNEVARLIVVCVHHHHTRPGIKAEVVKSAFALTLLLANNILFATSYFLDLLQLLKVMRDVGVDCAFPNFLRHFTYSILYGIFFKIADFGVIHSWIWSCTIWFFLRINKKKLLFEC